MLNYDLIVIGFGKAGKTLAAKMNAFSNAFICIIYVIVFLSCTFSVLCI